MRWTNWLVSIGPRKLSIVGPVVVAFAVALVVVEVGQHADLAALLFRALGSGSSTAIVYVVWLMIDGGAVAEGAVVSGLVGAGLMPRGAAYERRLDYRLALCNGVTMMLLIAIGAVDVLAVTAAHAG